jgi:uncharacterized protein (DUF983 family)
LDILEFVLLGKVSPRPLTTPQPINKPPPAPVRPPAPPVPKPAPQPLVPPHINRPPAPPPVYQPPVPQPIPATPAPTQYFTRYCPHCGAGLVDGAVICVKCGSKVTAFNPDDKRSFGFAFLSFWFPWLGLILFIVWHNSKPLRAKSCIIGFWIGFILSILFFIMLAIMVYSITREILPYLYILDYIFSFLSIFL